MDRLPIDEEVVIAMSKGITCDYGFFGQQKNICDVLWLAFSMESEIIGSSKNRKTSVINKNPELWTLYEEIKAQQPRVRDEQAKKKVREQKELLDKLESTLKEMK